MQIIQTLRRANGPIAAARIAEELEVSLRTLYRDMVSLESTGVPVRGEAGIGYILEQGFDMPPLMFTASELEAVMLGARMLEGRGDESLARAARDAVAKIAAVVPEHLRSVLIDTPLFVPQYQIPESLSVNTEDIRRSLRMERPVELIYKDLKDDVSNRVIWPVLMTFFDGSTVLAAWCTLRQDFRAFRIDRMIKYHLLDETLPKRRKTLFAEWRKSEHWRYRLTSDG